MQSALGIVLILLYQLLLAFALTQACALQLCPQALAQRAGTFASAFHIQDRHHGHMGCCPDARLEDTPFEMLIQSITRWGNSLHVPSLLCRTSSFGRGQRYCPRLTHWNTAYRQTSLQLLSALVMFGTECRRELQIPP